MWLGLGVWREVQMWMEMGMWIEGGCVGDCWVNDSEKLLEENQTLSRPMTHPEANSK